MKRNTSDCDLIAAARCGNEELIKELLERNVNSVDRWGYTPLRIASEKGHTSIVDVLVCHGADIDLADCNGWTPLIAASFMGHVTIVEILLRNGANVNGAEKDGLTPLCAAIRNRHKEIADILIAHGADVNRADHTGCGRLLAASSTGHGEIIEVLLAHGADANKPDEGGWTPMMAAVGNLRVMEILLRVAVDKDALYCGCTALRLAIGRLNIACVELLVHAGATVPESIEEELPVWFRKKLYPSSLPPE